MKKMRGIIVTCLALVGCLAFFIVGFPLVSIFIDITRIKRIEARMKQPAVYEPVGYTLARYCQSDRRFFPQEIDWIWFPPELKRLVSYGYGRINPQQARIIIGGGFHHYGYSLVLDEAHSNNRLNTWQLFMFSEDSADTDLMTFTLSPSEQFSADQLLSKILEEDNTPLSTATQYEYTDERQMKKMLLLLRFHKLDEAIQTCRDWFSKQPEYWLPRFAYAHLRARSGERVEAAREFSQWIGSHPNFAHYIYLFLFYMREHQEEEALQAIRQAIRQPFIEPPHTSGNKFYLGYNGAAFAFIMKDYALCIAMCDNMLNANPMEQAWHPKILQMKASATLLLGNQQHALEIASEMFTLLPRERRMISENDKIAYARYMTAMKDGQREFISHYDNWKDESSQWFSPFETDETGMHGRDDIPSPYPANYRCEY